ncbi:MAG: FAD-dependent oxidoreductase [Sulfuritalea sp.]|nr:FAD-dependent oxidoreductase [Sulfuritalea sp.]
MRYGVVGGGMLGLTLAMRLRAAGHAVTVVESAPELGGLASAWQVGEVTWDRYYHVIAGSDTTLCEMLAGLGLESAIVWRTTRTNFYDGKALRPLNDAFDYWRLPGLRLVDKARLAATILIAARISDGTSLERLSAQEWLTRIGGERTWRGLWRPLLRAKLGANVDHASAAYIWSVIRRFYGAREGGMKTERFGYVAGGYRQVVDTLAARLAGDGVVLRAGSAVTAISRDRAGLSIFSADQSIQCDRVLMTCAAPLAALLCADLGTGERQAMRQLRYQGIVCVSMLLTRPLGGAYMTYITDERIPFTTVIEMSTLVGRDRFAGFHLVYLPKYVPADDPIFEQDDSVVAADFMAGLARMFPDFLPSDIHALRISRTRHVLAVPTRNYQAQMPAMTTSVPGLFVVNSAQIVNAALSVNDTIRLAHASADRLLACAAP